MAELMKELCERIIADSQDEFGVQLVIGEHVFAGFVPVNTDTPYVAFLERTPGVLDAYIGQVRRYFYQIFIRGTSDYWQDYAFATALCEYLAKMKQVSLPSWTIFNIDGVSPGYLGVDEKGRHEFSANIQLKVRKEQ